MALTKEEETRICEETERAVQAYSDAIKRLDTDAILAFWPDSEDFVVAGDGTFTVGYDTWAEQMDGFINETAEVNHVELFNPHILVLAEDAASYATEFRWTMTTKAGETLKSHGSWMYVLKLMDGRWRPVHSAGTHLYE